MSSRDVILVLFGGPELWQGETVPAALPGDREGADEAQVNDAAWTGVHQSVVRRAPVG